MRLVGYEQKEGSDKHHMGCNVSWDGYSACVQVQAKKWKFYNRYLCNEDESFNPSVLPSV